MSVLALPDALIEHIVKALYGVDQLPLTLCCRALRTAVELLAKHVMEELQQRADSSFSFRAGTTLARYSDRLISGEGDVAIVSSFPFRCLVAAARRCHLYSLGGANAPGVLHVAATSDGQILSTGHDRQHGGYNRSWPSAGECIDVWRDGNHVGELHGHWMVVSGKWLVATDDHDLRGDKLAVYDLETMKLREGFTSQDWTDVVCEAFTADTNYIYALVHNNGPPLVQLWSLKTGELVREAEQHWTPSFGWPTTLHVSGGRLYLLHDFEDSADDEDWSEEERADSAGLHILSIESLARVARQPDVISFAGDDTRIVSLDREGNVVVTSTTTGFLATTAEFRIPGLAANSCFAVEVALVFNGLVYFRFESKPVSFMHMSSNKAYMAQQRFQYERIEAWDMQTACRVRILRWPQYHKPGHVNYPCSLATDGRHLILAFNAPDGTMPMDGPIKVWAL